MNATLNSLIRYEQGYIQVVESLEEPEEVTGAELVEGNCKGWGDSNAVVKFGGSHYLATVEGAEFIAWIGPAFRNDAGALAWAEYLAERCDWELDGFGGAYPWDTEIPPRAEWDRHVDEMNEHLSSHEV